MDNVLQSVLPDLSKRVDNAFKQFAPTFKPTTQWPKRINKAFVIWKLNQYIKNGNKVPDGFYTGLVRSEREYIAAVISEYEAFLASNPVADITEKEVEVE